MDEEILREETLKWKPILDSLNLDDKKKTWLSDYVIQHENNEIFNNTLVSSTDDTDFSSLLFPLVRNVAASTIALGSTSLDEDSYTNEKRKRILDDIFDDKETDYDKLEDLKKDYMVYNNDGLVSVQPMASPRCELNFLDFVYKEEDYDAPLKNNDMEE
jgi:hypothetical protein